MDCILNSYFLIQTSVFLSQLFSEPLLFLVGLVAMVLSITIHEFSHALVAHWQGDDTPESQGRLTLNPMAHIDLFGLLFLLVAGFGWGRPVIFNPYNLRARRWGPVLVGLAGPLTNIIAFFAFGFLLRLSMRSWGLSADNYLVMFFEALAVLNLSLAIFNLIPIPPLDGSKILWAIIPLHLEPVRLWLERFGTWLLLALVLLDMSGLSIFRPIFAFFFGLAERLFT